MTPPTPWHKDAEQRLKNAPFFVRSMARKKVEKAAKKAGLELITVEFMENIKKQSMGC